MSARVTGLLSLCTDACRLCTLPRLCGERNVVGLQRSLLTVVQRLLSVSAEAGCAEEADAGRMDMQMEGEGEAEGLRREEMMEMVEACVRTALALLAAAHAGDENHFGALCLGIWMREIRHVDVLLRVLAAGSVWQTQQQRQRVETHGHGHGQYQERSLPTLIHEDEGAATRCSAVRHMLCELGADPVAAGFWIENFGWGVARVEGGIFWEAVMDTYGSHLGSHHKQAVLKALDAFDTFEEEAEEQKVEGGSEPVHTENQKNGNVKNPEESAAEVANNDDDDDDDDDDALYHDAVTGSANDDGMQHPQRQQQQPQRKPGHATTTGLHADPPRTKPGKDLLTRGIPREVGVRLDRFCWFSQPSAVAAPARKGFAAKDSAKDPSALSPNSNDGTAHTTAHRGVLTGFYARVQNVIDPGTLVFMGGPLATEEARFACPALVQPLLGYEIVQVSIGGQHACALDAHGKVFTWGRGGFGRLGTGNVEPRDSPTLVESLASVPVQRVACGFAYTGAVTTRGEVYMWGAGERGRLGVGLSADQLTPTLVNKFAATGIRIVDVQPGSVHTCFLDVSGAVYGTGQKEYNGLGGDGDVVEPQLIDSFDGHRVTQLAVGPGGYHTIVLTDTNEVWTWGHNRVGQLGARTGRGPGEPYNIEAAKYRPIPLKVELPPDVHPSKVVAGWGHSMIVTNEGNLYACGRVYKGQLGLGSPEQFPRNERGHPFNPEFKLVSALEHVHVRDAYCGGEHTVVVTDNDEVYSFGWGEAGQLLQGPVDQLIYPRLVPMGYQARRSVRSVAIGNLCTMIVLGRYKPPTLSRLCHEVIAETPELREFVLANETQLPRAIVHTAGLMHPQDVDTVSLNDLDGLAHARHTRPTKTHSPAAWSAYVATVMDKASSEPWPGLEDDMRVLASFGVIMDDDDANAANTIDGPLTHAVGNDGFARATAGALAHRPHRLHQHAPQQLDAAARFAIFAAPTVRTAPPYAMQQPQSRATPSASTAAPRSASAAGTDPAATVVEPTSESVRAPVATERSLSAARAVESPLVGGRATGTGTHLESPPMPPPVPSGIVENEGMAGEDDDGAAAVDASGPGSHNAEAVGEEESVAVGGEARNEQGQDHEQQLPQQQQRGAQRKGNRRGGSKRHRRK